MTSTKTFLTTAAAGMIAMSLAACGIVPPMPGGPSDIPEQRADTTISPDMQIPRASPAWKVEDTNPIPMLSENQRKAFDNATNGTTENTDIVPIVLLAIRGEEDLPTEAAYLARDTTDKEARWVVATVGATSDGTIRKTPIVANELLTIEQRQEVEKQAPNGWKQSALLTDGAWTNTIPKSHQEAIRNYAQACSEQVVTVAGAGNLGTLTDGGTIYTLYLVALHNESDIPSWMFMTVAGDSAGHAVVAGSDSGYMDLWGYIGK